MTTQGTPKIGINREMVLLWRCNFMYRDRIWGQKKVVLIGKWSLYWVVLIGRFYCIYVLLSGMLTLIFFREIGIKNYVHINAVYCTVWLLSSALLVPALPNHLKVKVCIEVALQTKEVTNWCVGIWLPCYSMTFHYIAFLFITTFHSFTFNVSLTLHLWLYISVLFIPCSVTILTLYLIPFQSV